MVSPRGHLDVADSTEDIETVQRIMRVRKVESMMHRMKAREMEVKQFMLAVSVCY